ncbi:hypothetical protein LZC95_50180 [Pendulispora brunnea]|uniref:Uncharacterized protein n=1 Tax=Pendulispora brunnea TaxID=2905690 RepID=A0ABZ2K7C8_9BACT
MSKLDVDDLGGGELAVSGETLENVQTIESWAAAKGTPTWLVAALKVRQHWAIGKLVSEHEYDAAAKAAAEMTIGRT